MINIKNLKKKFKNFQALNDISFSIKKGDFFSLLGKNGAGKSTTIGILTSLIKKDSGKILINNYDLDKNVIEIKSLIGFMPQEYNFNQFESIYDIILNQAGFYGIKKSCAIDKAEELLTIFDLWKIRFSTSMTLSGGMKRRLMLARALIHDPEILILDEPTAGVDILSRHLIWQFLKDINKNGKTIILTSHYIEEIEKLCNTVAIIDKGYILSKTSVSELMEKVHNKTFIIETENENTINKPIELCLKKNEYLNEKLNSIINKNIKIKNIKNKSNDLEDIFIKMIS